MDERKAKCDCRKRKKLSQNPRLRAICFWQHLAYLDEIDPIARLAERILTKSLDLMALRVFDPKILDNKPILTKLPTE